MISAKLVGRQQQIEAMAQLSASGQAGGSDAARKPTNVSLNAALLAEAKALKLNVSQAAEAGLLMAVEARRAELWLQANQAALESSNAYAEQHGLPLARHRQF